MGKKRNRELDFCFFFNKGRTEAGPRGLRCTDVSTLPSRREGGLRCLLWCKPDESSRKNSPSASKCGQTGGIEPNERHNTPGTVQIGRTQIPQERNRFRTLPTDSRAKVWTGMKSKLVRRRSIPGQGSRQFLGWR